MKRHRQLIDLEKLTNLFFFFVVGTLSLIIRSSINIPEFRFKESLLFTLLIIFILTYEFVIISLVSHYITKGKKHYVLHKEGYLYSIAFVLLVTFSATDALHQNSWLVLIRDLALTVLTVFVGPIIIKNVKKKLNWKNETNNKIQTN